MRSARRPDGFRAEAARDGEGLADAVLPDPRGALARGVFLKRNRYRAVARVPLPPDGEAALKVHVPCGLPDALRSAVRASRARLEWRAARYLVGAGLPTGEPLLAADRRRAGRLLAAVFASRWLPDRRPFDAALRAQGPRESQALLSRAGALLRALHDRGASHGDFHGGNLLAGPGPGDRCPLHVIDLHTMRVGRPLPERRRVAQVARWLHGLAGCVGPAGRLRTLVAYLGGRPARADLRAWWRRLGRSLRAWERRRVRSRSRRCREENTDFTREVGGGTGMRRLTLPLGRIDEVLAAHDATAREGGAGLLKRGRKSVVTRHGDLVVKEALASSAGRRLSRALLPRLLRAGYDNAHRLDVLGLDPARPMAFLRRGGRTFTLYEDAGGFERLDHLVRDRLRSGAWDRQRLRAALDATADLAARLHRLGAWHGDLKACNWLVREGAQGFAFRLVDTDRVAWYRRPVPWRRRMRNLAQLAGSVPVAVSRSDRLRWWRRYALGTPWQGRVAERRAAAAVARLLAGRTVVLDAPIE